MEKIEIYVKNLNFESRFTITPADFLKKTRRIDSPGLFSQGVTDIRHRA